MSKDQVIVRPATLEDCVDTAIIHGESIRGLCAEHYTPEQIHAWHPEDKPENMRIGMTEKGLIPFIAEHNNRAVGFSLLDPATNTLLAVYVLPEYAGKGVGRLLTEAIEVEAVKQGCELLQLDSSMNALPFYKRCGYIEGEHTTHRLNTGVDIPCVKMHKNLRS